MTVWAVQNPLQKKGNRVKPRYDLSAAGLYGPIQTLLRPDQKPFQSKQIIDTLYIKLKDFSDEDFIICIGNPILLALAVNVAFDINEGRANLLQWNRDLKEYDLVRADLGFTSDE